MAVASQPTLEKRESMPAMGWKQEGGYTNMHTTSSTLWQSIGEWGVHQRSLILYNKLETFDREPLTDIHVSTSGKRRITKTIFIYQVAEQHVINTLV